MPKFQERIEAILRHQFTAREPSGSHFKVVAEDILKAVEGGIEQRHENEQVRRLQVDGRCPVCGAYSEDGRY